MTDDRDPARADAETPDERPWAADEGATVSGDERSAPLASSREFNRGDHVELARASIDDLRAGAASVADEGSIYVYGGQSGLWRAIDPTEHSRTIQAYAGAKIIGEKRALSVRATDVNGAIKLAYAQVAAPGFFGDARAGIAFTNGFVHVDASGVHLTPHAEENRARHAYGFAFERGAVPKAFLKFLAGLFLPDADRIEKEMLVQEFFGGAIVGVGTQYQQAIVGIGSGDNGKSALGAILEAAMPKGSTCSIPPQLFEQEYRRAQLAGKLLNIVAELPERDILDSESFKAIITGDIINARAIREAPVNIRPRASHVFFANNLPGTNDQSEGFWRRLIALTFSRSFKGDPERDPDIVKRIVATELAAIVAWLLDGAARLMRERQYTLPASHEKALAAWRRSADQIAMFLDDTCEDPAPLSNGTSGAELYRLYTTWATKNGHRPVSNTKLGLRLAELGKKAKHTSAGNFYPVAVKGCEGLVKGSGGNPSRDWRVNPDGSN